NAVSICHACGLKTITRLERSRRFKLIFTEQAAFTLEQIADIHSSLLYDRMTECHYPEPLATFESGIQPAPVVEVRL
ncbi:MAG: hypothetical protein GTO60_12895, partial [Gammaproteobacteria bacterium]|nr:hypothetical protein [Gammaproteobacteria bacterium]